LVQTTLMRGNNGFETGPTPADNAQRCAPRKKKCAEGCSELHRLFAGMSRTSYDLSLRTMKRYNNMSRR
jgi:hypothetical protein